MPAHELSFPVSATNIALKDAEGEEYDITLDTDTFDRAGEDGDIPILPLNGGDEYVGESLEGQWHKGWDANISTFTATISGGTLRMTGVAAVAGTAGRGWVDNHHPIPLLDELEITVSMEVPIDDTGATANRDIINYFFLKQDKDELVPDSDDNYIRINTSVAQTGLILQIYKEVNGVNTLLASGYDYTMAGGRNTGNLEATIWRLVFNGKPGTTGATMSVYLKQAATLALAEAATENEVTGSPFDISDLAFNIGYPSYQIYTQNTTYFGTTYDSANRAASTYLRVSYPSQFNCYDDETEVLTRDGFKYFKDVTDDDEIATLNKDGYLEYHKPLARQAFTHTGDMIHWSSQRYDLKVTPDHNMYVRRHHNRKHGWEFVKAEDMLKESHQRYELNKTCKWIGCEPDYFMLPLVERVTNEKLIEKIDTETFLRFMGWYLSEGCYIKNGASYVAQLSQCDEDVRNEFCDIIKKMGFSPSISGNDVRFYSKQFYTYLSQFGKAHQKHVPRWIKNLSPRLLKIFLETYLRGDGSRGKIIGTSSKQMVDDLTEIIIKCGYSTTSSLCANKGDAHMIDGREIKNNHDMYCLTVSRDSVTPQIRTKSMIEKYSGIVYDLTVPNHTLFVRRNGKCQWSGNCNYDFTEANYGDGEVALYDGNPDTTGVRVYDEDHVFANDCYIQNGLIRLHIDDGTQYGYKASYYNGGSYATPAENFFITQNTSSKDLQYIYMQSIDYVSPEKIVINTKLTDTGSDNDDYYILIKSTIKRGEYYIKNEITEIYPSQSIQLGRLYSISAPMRFGYVGNNQIGDDDLGVNGENDTLSDNVLTLLDNAGDSVLVNLFVDYKPDGSDKRFRAFDGRILVIDDYTNATSLTLSFYIGFSPFSNNSDLFKEGENGQLISGATAVVDVLASNGQAALLDASAEETRYNINAGTNLPAGRYLIVFRARDINQIANDLQVFVTNASDSQNRIETNSSRNITLTATYAYYSYFFDVTDTDVSGTDDFDIRARKATATANEIYVDYFLIIPIGDGMNFPQDLSHSALRGIVQHPRICER